MVLPKLIQFQGYSPTTTPFFKKHFPLAFFSQLMPHAGLAPFAQPLCRASLPATTKPQEAWERRPCLPAGTGTFPPREGVWWPGRSPDSNPWLGLPPLSHGSGALGGNLLLAGSSCSRGDRQTDWLTHTHTLTHAKPVPEQEASWSFSILVPVAQAGAKKPGANSPRSGDSPSFCGSWASYNLGASLEKEYEIRKSTRGVLASRRSWGFGFTTTISSGVGAVSWGCADTGVPWALGTEGRRRWGSRGGFSKATWLSPPLGSGLRGWARKRAGDPAPFSSCPQCMGRCSINPRWPTNWSGTAALPPLVFLASQPYFTSRKIPAEMTIYRGKSARVGFLLPWIICPSMCPGMNDTNFRVSPPANDVITLLHKPGIWCSRAPGQ